MQTIIVGISIYATSSLCSFYLLSFSPSGFVALFHNLPLMVHLIEKRPLMRPVETSVLGSPNELAGLGWVRGGPGNAHPSHFQDLGGGGGHAAQHKEAYRAAQYPIMCVVKGKEGGGGRKRACNSNPGLYTAGTEERVSASLSKSAGLQYAVQSQLA